MLCTILEGLLHKQLLSPLCPKHRSFGGIQECSVLTAAPIGTTSDAFHINNAESQLVLLRLTVT